MVAKYERLTIGKNIREVEWWIIDAHPPVRVKTALDRNVDKLMFTVQYKHVYKKFIICYINNNVSTIWNITNKQKKGAKRCELFRPSRLGYDMAHFPFLQHRTKQMLQTKRQNRIRSCSHGNGLVLSVVNTDSEYRFRYNVLSISRS